MEAENGRMPGDGPGSEAAGREPVERLAEAFFERYRRGERPSITEYVEKHPELAGEIRELFPALLLMEQAGGGTAAGDEALGNAGMPMPQRLGEYRLLREIGRGGMGVVYEAEQESLGRRVALKVLPFHSFFDGRRIERFRRESRAAASLHHPNIVPIHAVGEIDGIHYYTMQFIDGQSLDAVIAEVKRLRDAASSGSGSSSDTESGASTATLLRDGSGRISINDSHLHYHRSAARICLQAAEALAAAHGEGILHRDIKPSNLLLDAQGKLWVADFGLAKEEGTAELTLSGDLIGTLRYMAPERLQGWSDHRSDIYSLGLTLYELLTLQPAFKDSDRTRLIRQVADAEPPPPRRHDRRIPLDLETIVIKAIAKEPGRRYPSASDLADDLRRFLANEPIRARSVTHIERAWRWCRRKPAIAALAGAVSVLLVVIAAGASITALELREKLRDSRLGEARMSRLTRRDGQRFRSLEAIRGAAGIRPGPDLRDEAIACLSLVDIVDELRCWAPPADSVIVPFNFDADMERFAYSDERASVSIRETGSGRELLAIPGFEGKTEHLVFSPDGGHLAVMFERGGRHFLQLTSLETGTPALESPLPFAPSVAAACFSPDSRLLAAGRSDGTISILDLLTGKERNRLPFGAALGVLVFHPEGRLLAAIGRFQAAVRVIDIESGRTVRTFPHSNRVHIAAWSPDGRRLAAGTEDRSIDIWDLDSGLRRLRLEGHQAQVVRLAFHPRGDLLASGDWAGTTRLWDPRSGAWLLSASGSAYHFSRDGRRLGFLFPDHEAGVLAVAPAAEWRWIPLDAAVDKQCSSLVFAYAGRLLAGGTDAAARLWDLETLEEVAAIPIKACRYVEFTEDGKTLITGGRNLLAIWPVEENVDTLRIGPPRVIDREVSLSSAALSHDGRILAVADQGRNQAHLYDLESGGKRTLEAPPRSVNFISLSPDGAWTAAGSWAQVSGVRIWDSATGKPAHDIPTVGTSRVLFTPDGRSLMVGTLAENRRYEVGSWRQTAALSREGARDAAGESACTEDGGLLAVSASRTLIQLVDPATFRSLARIESPESRAVGDICFGPGGDLLAAATFLGIQVWDLRRIREQLRALGLDWEPRLPPSGRAAAPGKPLRVAIDLGELTPLVDEKAKARAGMLRTIAEASAAIGRDPGDAAAHHRRAHAYEGLGLGGGAAADFRAAIEIHSRRIEGFEAAPANLFLERAACRRCSGDHAGAIGDFRKALEIEPRSPRAIEGLVWALLTAPLELRDAEQALPLALDAVETADRKQKPLTALGAAYYRLGKYSDAVEALDRACAAHERDGTPLDFLFLAMCHHRLGDSDRARYYFDRAESAIDGVPEPPAAEHRLLDSLRAEARALIDPEGER